MNSPHPGFLPKLRYKFRYNSWARLGMNALKRIGITVLPYYVFHRDITGQQKHPDPEGYEFDELEAEDMSRIAKLPLVHSSEQTYRRRLRDGQRCFALKQGGDICAFSWMDSDHCSFSGEGFTLRANEVYMYDIYTALDRRGQNLAPMLNACYSARLRAEGIHTILSIVDSLNRSSLNYVKKVGCVAQRKKLYLNLFGLLKKSIVLKIFVEPTAIP